MFKSFKDYNSILNVPFSWFDINIMMMFVASFHFQENIVVADFETLERMIKNETVITAAQQLIEF
jgi:hypothetical protein